MKEKEEKKLLYNVAKAKAKYDSCMGDIASYAKQHTEFPYDDIVFCEFQASDGYVIVLDAGNSCAPYNMPLDNFFRIVKEKGIVTIDDFDRESI